MWLCDHWHFARCFALVVSVRDNYLRSFDKGIYFGQSLGISGEIYRGGD
jgi:hypothetical protein